MISEVTIREVRIAAGCLLAVALALISTLGYFNWHAEHFQNYVGELVLGLSIELTGIGVTVLVVDGLYQWHARQQERTRLILQMGSPVNADALEAVRILRARGWLTDGSLEGSDLRGANLKDAELQCANLNRVDLRGSKLVNAKLQRARLREADLRGTPEKVTDLDRARLEEADLTRAEYNRHTKWPKGFSPCEATKAEK